LIYQLEEGVLKSLTAIRGLFIGSILVCTTILQAAAPVPEPIATGEELAVLDGQPGEYGGRLVVAFRAEPKTFNPLNALDQPLATSSEEWVLTCCISMRLRSKRLPL
jgi:hypothetical protein